jgi:proteasome lid subunit RPN8/RPN11
MMSLVLSPVQRQQLYDHAQQVYPEECCGLLLGHWDGVAQHRVVLQVMPLTNQWTTDVQGTMDAAVADAVVASPDLNRQHRYWIDPKDLLGAQRYARDRGWVVLGIYHSHPDHPAVPSECDRALAWTEYSYPILAVHQGQVRDFQSWRLDDAHQFQPEPIESEDATNLP